MPTHAYTYIHTYMPILYILYRVKPLPTQPVYT